MQFVKGAHNPKDPMNNIGPNKEATLFEAFGRAADGHDVTHRFIASDDPLQFLQLGQRFLGGTIEGVEICTLG